MSISATTSSLWARPRAAAAAGAGSTRRAWRNCGRGRRAPAHPQFVASQVAAPCSARHAMLAGYPRDVARLIDLASPYQKATPADCPALAGLVHLASEGLALALWTKVAPPGVDAWTVGRERATREAGAVSYRNAILVDLETGVDAGLIGYPLADTPEPAPQQLPPIAAPLQELQDMAPG